MCKLLNYDTLVQRSIKSSYINREILILNKRTVKYLGLQNLCFVEKKKSPEIEYGIHNQPLVFSVHVTSIERYQNTPCFSSINIFQGNPNINYIKYLLLILAHHQRKRNKQLQDWSNFFQASYIHNKRHSSLFQGSTVSVNHLENTLNHYFWRPFYDILDCLHASEKVWLFKNTVKTTLILTTVPMLNLEKNYFLGLCFFYIF